MKRILLCTSLVLAFSATAQDYEWQWAKRGGGKKGAQGESSSSFDYRSEHIADIAVDADNNYYYLAFMTQLDTEYDGTPVTVYNSDSAPSGNTDLVLISTDCSGTLRWTQTIGGGDQDFSYNIQLDDNGGLYIGANIINISGPSPNPYLPPHFSPTDAQPVLADDMGEPQEGYKTAALLKYNTNDGSLAWRIMPQGDVTLSLRYAQIHNLQVQPDGTIHALIGFAAGTHLNGQVTVPGTFNNTYKYHLVKFDAEGEVLNVLPLSLEGVALDSRTSFRYDPGLERYYLAGMRNNGGNFDLIDLSFNGIPFTEQTFVLAFSNTGNELWRKEMDAETEFRDTRIHDVKVDADSNVYMVGSYYSGPEWEVTMGDYQFPGDISGHRMFVMKLSATGVVQWVKVPSGYNTSFGGWTGVHMSYDIVINGNELAVATQVSDEIWDDVSIDRPDNHLDDPGLLRLNKTTGQVIALHDIMTTAGSRDGLTAVALDNDGNYITGGFFYNDLFTLTDDNVATLTKVGGYQTYTDFFIAKLAASACGSGTSGLQDQGYNTIKVFPNPSKGLINITADEGLASYTLVNVLGQVLLRGQLESSQNTISIESLSAGTYILNISSANGNVVSHKVIKE